MPGYRGEFNQPGMVPRLSGGKPLSPSSKTFLDGKVRTYFGRGQDPTIVGAGSSYLPPTSWPKGVLRVPKVCWMTVWFADCIYDDFLVGRPDSGDLIGYCQDSAAEHNRVYATMLAAKAQIESERPDILVDVFNLQDPVGFAFPDYPDYGASQKYLIQPNPGEDGRSGPFLVPVDTNPYFGVDFYHIHAGDLYMDRTMGAEFDGFHRPPFCGGSSLSKFSENPGSKELVGNRYVYRNFDSINELIQYCASHPEIYFNFEAQKLQERATQIRRDAVKVTKFVGHRASYFTNSVPVYPSDTLYVEEGEVESSRRYMEVWCAELAPYGYGCPGDSGLLTGPYLAGLVKDHWPIT